MIRVNDDYIIEIDNYNFTAKRDLHQARIKKDGSTEDQFKTVGYYGDFSSAIRGIIRDMNIRELSDGVKTLEEALGIILKNNIRFEELLTKVLEVSEV